MAKHSGIVIRRGAAHDRIDIASPKGNASFDMHAIRTGPNGRNVARRVQRDVVDAWAEINGFRKDNKDKRALRREHNKVHKRVDKFANAEA